MHFDCGINDYFADVILVHSAFLLYFVLLGQTAEARSFEFNHAFFLMKFNLRPRALASLR